MKPTDLEDEFHPATTAQRPLHVSERTMATRKRRARDRLRARREYIDRDNGGTYRDKYAYAFAPASRAEFIGRELVRCDRCGVRVMGTPSQRESHEKRCGG